MKVVILGGVAAGMSAASKIRRNDPNAEIVVYEKGLETSYGACGLPYYISGDNDNLDLMRIRKADEFRTKQNIDVKLLHEAVGVNPDEKIVRIANLETGEKFIDSYDKLIIATGASPIIPPIKGISQELTNLFTVKTLQDGETIKNYLGSDVKKVVIAGAGYIGLEMVEACHQQGKEVTLIELQDGLLASVDGEIGNMIANELSKHNIIAKTSEKIIEVITENNKIVKVVTDKNSYETDMLVMATGVRPNTKFLEGTGIKLTDKGAVDVNTKMETSIADVYSGGDCATVYHKLLKKNVYLPLGTNANKQGKMLADNICGDSKELICAVGSAAIKVLDLEVARTGLSEKEAIANNVPYKSVTTKAPIHAPYYPGNSDIFIKLIYCSDTKHILGAQLAGAKGVALRCNMFTILIDGKYTPEQIQDLDFLYAPPYSYVWDAVQLAAGRIK